MRRKTLAFAFAFVFGCALAAVSLSPAARAADGQPVPDMDERVLWERYHIPPTKEGLLTALHHSDASVRTFAAARLAARGEKDVAPAILAALRAEALPGARTLIAVGSREARRGGRGPCCPGETVPRSERIRPCEDRRSASNAQPGSRGVPRRCSGRP